MVSDKQTIESAKKFEPLEIMGIFWLVFGIIVLVSTFFVKGTAQVPLVRGVVTNIIAGLLLLGAGIFSIVKAKVKKRRKDEVHKPAEPELKKNSPQNTQKDTEVFC